jgi:hypothetical protein
MEKCVRSARQAGVFKPFQVLTDRPLAGCECYDAFQCDKADGLFKLHYLKAGMSRLNFDYFIWLDADTVFARNPVDALGPLGRSPIHVPLETNLSALAEDHEWKGVSGFRLREVFHREGLAEPVYFSRSAFWIVHHEAIEPVYELALRFWHQARQAGLKAGVDAALGYAMHLLCADTEAHLLAKHPELWGSDDGGRFEAAPADSGPWQCGRRPGPSVPSVLPAIIHLGRRSGAAGRSEPLPGTSVVAPCVTGDTPPEGGLA